MKQTTPGVRSPVKREGAEQYLLLSLVSFAISVILTRLFLQLTGYPLLGTSELHIAHVLWGGVLLFIAALLPIIFANRWILNTAAIIGGAGMGLFIDEVGKFITQSNDYFYPPAASIIYAFFLLTVFLYLNVRRSSKPNIRSNFYLILANLEEILDHDLDPDERAQLVSRLSNIIVANEDDNLQHLAISLAEYLKSEQIDLVEPKTTAFQRGWNTIMRLVRKTITRPRLKTFLILTLGGMGVLTIIEFGGLLLALPSQHYGIEVLLTPLITSGEVHSAREALWYIIRTILEGGTGILLIVSGGMLVVGKEDRGMQLATLALVIWLTVINLLVFFLDQFSAVITAVFQLIVLLAVTYYRQQFLQKVH
jgi:hypothetical protein